MTGRTIACLSLAAAVLSGCAAPEVRYMTVPLPCPERPVLPGISEADLACLSDAAYRRLVERERLRREYAEQLDALCRSTHDG